MPNLAYVVDHPKPGVTVKSGQRGLHNLMGRGFGGSTDVGGGYDYRLKSVSNGTAYDYSNDWRDVEKRPYPAASFHPLGPAEGGKEFGFSDGGHSWLTMGEYRCLSDDTECLTSSGWKKYGEITKETRVACYNEKTDCLEYHRPSEVHVYDYAGPLFYWKHKAVDIAVTPNHTMPIWVMDSGYYRGGREGKESATYGRGDGQLFTKEHAAAAAQRALFRVKHSAPMHTSCPQFVYLPMRGDILVRPAPGRKAVYSPDVSSAIPSDTWAEFVGWYISEGWCEKDRPRFGLCQKEGTGKADDIHRLLTRLPDRITWSRSTAASGACWQWRATDEALHEHLRDNFGSGNEDKRLPDYVKEWPAELLRILLGSAVAGDGSVSFDGKNGGRSFNYNTVSKQLAEDIQEIATKCGYRAVIWDCPPRGNQRSLCYRVGISTSTNKSEIRKEHLKIEHYCGKVWCVTVPTGMFVVRRNGKVHITGNSKALSVVKPHEDLEPLESDHPFRRLIENPNPIDTHYDIEYEKRMFRLLCGVSYEWIVPNDFGQPAERWCIPSHWVWPRTGGGRYVSPDLLTQFPHADELIQYYEIRPWGGMGSAGMLRFPPDEVIMEIDKSPINKIDGYSPLAAMAQWIDLDESISKSRWAQMMNQARPELWIELGPGYEDPTDERIMRMEAKLAARFQGEYNYAKPIVTPPGAKLTPLSWSPQSMAYGDSSDQTRDMILSGFAVPPSAVGLSRDMTYGSILATLSALCEFCLNPKLTSSGQTQTKHLASRFDERAPAYSTYSGAGGRASKRRVRLWYDSCTPADPSQVNSDITTDIQGYALTPNELRALRGRKAYKNGGDDPMGNGPVGIAPIPLNTGDSLEALAQQLEPMAQITGESKRQPSSEQTGGSGPVDGEVGGAESTEAAAGPVNRLPSQEGEAPETDFSQDAGVEDPNGKPTKYWANGRSRDKHLAW